MHIRSTLFALFLVSSAVAQGSDFFHWESPHVHPISMSPDGNTLVAVNTPDARLEVFSLATGVPLHTGSVAVGVDPVSVRMPDNQFAWVVNNISDSISIVDVTSLHLKQTLQTRDEPSDVVFTTNKAWVSCSQPNLVLVFDRSNLAASPVELDIVGEDPRAMTISPDGSKVFVAVHMSGNNTTVLNGEPHGFMPDVVSDPSGPWGGLNPPPNSPPLFSPPLNPNHAPVTPPPTSLIVKKDSAGAWRDDAGGDWTTFVTGGLHGRAANWDMWDHDIAVIDTGSNNVSYARGAMNAVMSIAIQPGGPSGYGVTVCGTEATNEIRFEPNINGTFVRTRMARSEPNGQVLGSTDLNPHIASYQASTVPQATRDLSVGIPRFHVWDSTGTFCWVAGLGSNNIGLFDAGGNRITQFETDAGPSGLVLHEPMQRLFVLNKFASTITMFDAATSALLATIPLHDPTPWEVKLGRKHLYDTHATSGLGHLSCASCHHDARADGLAWDLGNPAGDLQSMNDPNFDLEFGPFVRLSPARPVDRVQWFHPMKGPMVTQSLQDIIGKEPFHWRGDRASLEDFNGAYEGLQGDDEELSQAQMDEFKRFLGSIAIPPNPYRTITDDLSSSVDLAKLGLHWRPKGGGNPVALSSGDAQRGQTLFLPPTPVGCFRCHSAPVGIGADMGFNTVLNQWVPAPVGPLGEHYSALTQADPNHQGAFKIAALRHIHRKTGFNGLQKMNTRGFGYLHDGGMDTISHFISEFTHPVGSELQDTADLTAFMLSFASTGLPQGSLTDPQNPPGQPARNTHAGVGTQWTVATNPPTMNDLLVIGIMLGEQQQDPSHYAIVVKQNLAAGGQRGYSYNHTTHMFDSDAVGTSVSLLSLLLSIGAGTEATFTAVPAGSQARYGVDRDADGFHDADEIALGTDPANPQSVPPASGSCTTTVPAAPSGLVTAAPVGPHSVILTWSDNSSNETGFLIERARTNSPQWEVVGEVGQDAVQFHDLGVSAASSYMYRVRSYNCAGAAVSAVLAGVVTLAVPTTPTVHVHAIDLNVMVIQNPPSVYVYGVVEVVDEQNRHVKNATVTVSYSGGVTGNTTAVTNDQGEAFFMTANLNGPTSVTLTVNNIAGTAQQALVYDPVANRLFSKTVSN